MKIEINNLGPIHHFEFDLEKDLHLLYGGNNVGKSFAVNVVYCVLKGIVEKSSVSMTYFSLTLDLSREERMMKTFEEYFFSNIKDSLNNTYSTFTGIQNKDGEIIIDFGKMKISIQIDESGKPFLHNVVFLEKEELYDLDPNGSKGLLNYIADFKCLITNFKQLYLLPSSKSGLYGALSGMGTILAEMSKLRNHLKSKIELPSLQEPISDFYLNLMSSDEETFNHEFVNLGKKIESAILKGSISLNKQSNKIYYLPFGKKDAIHITETASMVSELAPLVLFLKNVITLKEDEKTILIIEEPEAHLHPEIQVKLMEIFAELTKHNVKVILTSHSDFMLNKTTNMILEKSLNPDKVGVYHMEMTDKGSVVRPDMKATEEGIEDHNFMDVSTQLYEERMRILENQNAQINAAGTN